MINRLEVKRYIEEQPIKVVTVFDTDKNKIAYTAIKQHREIKDITGDEEVVRAYLITRLVNELGYQPDRIEIEHEYTAGRAPKLSPRCDLLVRDLNGNAFLFFELKSPSDYATLDKDKTINDQLFDVAALEKGKGSKVNYLILYTINYDHNRLSDECIVIDNEKFATYTDWEVLRDSVNTVPTRYGKAQKKPFIKASVHDLETDFTTDALSRLQIDLHNVLWGGGGTDDNEVFSSLVNLILAKIQDEDEKEDGDIYDFQSLTFAKDGDEQFETNEQLFERINALYPEIPNTHNEEMGSTPRAV